MSGQVAGRILLVGMMGCGKTTTGSMLAERLGWPYLDSDAEILRRTGKTVPEIWHESGEAAFRAEESAVLAQATTSDGPAVVAVAGGAVLDADNRSRVRHAGMVVWLRADASVLAARVGRGDGRPLLDSDPAGSIRRLAAEREPVYAEIADVVVDVDTLTPADVADRIVGEWDARCSS